MLKGHIHDHILREEKRSFLHKKTERENVKSKTHFETDGEKAKRENGGVEMKKKEA